MRWTWTGCVVVAAAAAASSFAQDAKEQTDRLVVKARITGAKFEPGDTPTMFPLFDEGGVPSGMQTNATFDLSSGAIECVVTASKLGGPGHVYVSFPTRSDIGSAIVFADSMRGELDLGELPLGPSAPPLVSGRVVTADGAAAYGARVYVSCGSSKARTYRMGDFSAATDETGAFRIRGVIRGRDSLVLELGVEDGWVAEKAIPFTAGAKDLTLVATRTSGVHGTVVVPDGLPLPELVVLLRGPPGGVADAQPEQANAGYRRGDDTLEFPAARSFNVTGLRPGTYDVRLKFAGSSRWLARLPEVAVDETPLDLPPLKVTDPIGHLTARVAAADGAVPQNAELWARSDGDRGNYRRVALGPDGSASVAFVGDGVSLAARAEGTDFVLVQRAEPDVKLTLPKPVPAAVTIQVSGDVKGSADDTGPSIVLKWEADASVAEEQIAWAKDDTDPRTGTEVEAKFPPKGPVVANVTVAGWYGIGVRVKRERSTFTRYGIDRVRVERGRPASASVAVSAEDLSPPKFPPPK